MKTYLYVATMIAIIGVGLVTYKCVTVNVPDGINSKESSAASKLRKKLKKVTTTTTKPDGSSETIITEEKESVKEVSKRNNRIDVSIKRSYDRIKELSVYEATYSRRVLDSVWLGVGVGSDKTAHVKAGVEF
jgi:hypothetical protein